MRVHWALAVGLLGALAGCSAQETEVGATPGPAADAADSSDAFVLQVEDTPSPVADQGPPPPPPDVPTDAGPPPVPDVPPAPPDVPPPPPDAPGPPPGSPTTAWCFADQLPPSGVPLVDYDPLGPTLGGHCKGTNHQDIKGVERVVFVGDSVTVGTPPTDAKAWYRNVVAADLVDRFDLQPPEWAWENVDLLSGVVYQNQSGDFACCAKWGARTDDILKPPHQQLVTCNPSDQREKTTLVIMTVGGNDVFKWAQDRVQGTPIADLWVLAEKAVGDMEEAVHWLVDDPATFPNGVFVVFANTFEFTDVDSGNDFATCPGADIIAMDTALVEPEFSEIVAWMMAEYMRIAVETGTDMAFMGEHTCGHGHMYDNPEGRCYRGPGASLWLDITCMHPSADGHAGIADLFLAVVDE